MSIEESQKINEEYQFLNTIKEIPPKKSGKLDGYSISVKDCICVKDMHSRGGSKILSSYEPVFDATVIKKIKEQGATIIAKTAQDEFGFGSFSVNVGVGMDVPKNPFDKERSCGGSSGGSAGFTQKAEFKHISLGESTGGSIVCPASFCGVHALCPTYGLVSRYGLMDYGSSLDKIGPMAKSVREIALALSVITGYDERDSTSVKREKEDYEQYLGKDIKGLKIGLLKDSFSEGVSKEIQDQLKEKVEFLKGKGAMVEEIELPLNSKYSLSTYYLIAMCEASTNLAKYCGMRYGVQEEMNEDFNSYFSKVRSANFSDEAKRRIMIGTFARMSGFRDAYYIKALKVRTKLIEEYKEVFKNFDVILSPTMPVIAPRFDEIEKMTPLQNYMMDIFQGGVNLCGLPHMNIPMGKVEGMPTGLQIVGDHFEEGKLIQLASVFEK